MSHRHLLSIDDLDADDIDWILARAHMLADGAPPTRDSFNAALLFLSSSLRTRLGFGTAVGRLGGTVIDVSEMRWDSKMSAAESFEDTVRTVTGMVDLTIVRAPVDLRESVDEYAASSVICGGDLVGHPSQALIDVFAMERLHRPVGELRVAMVGDLTMRASRSLLQLFERRPPAELVLICPMSRNADAQLVKPLVKRVREGSLDDLSEVDCVLMCGLTPISGGDRLDEAARTAYRMTQCRLDTLADDGIVLSPLPVIDEIDATSRRDARVRMFEQSDLSVHVRVALIERLLETIRASGVSVG